MSTPPPPVSRSPSDERTPLLAPEPALPRRKRFSPTLQLSLLLALLLSASLSIALTSALLLRSFQPTPEAQSEAITFRGPSSIKLLSISPPSPAKGAGQRATVLVTAQAGIDGDRLLTLSHETLWDRLRSNVGRTSLDWIHQVNVSLPDVVYISTGREGGEEKVGRVVPVTRSIVLPLTTGRVGSVASSAEDDDWLSTVSFVVDCELLATPHRLLSLGKQAWKEGGLDVQVEMEGGSVAGVGRLLGGLKKGLGDIEKELWIDLPNLPPMDNITSLLTLHSYAVFRPSSSDANSTSSELLVLANCSIPNPALSFPDSDRLNLDQYPLHWSSGVGWIAKVVIPSEPLGQPVGRMQVLPFDVDLSAERIWFEIKGELVAQRPVEVELTPPLEAFLTAYLHQTPYPLHLTPYALSSSSPLSLIPSMMLNYGPLQAPVPPPDPPLKPLKSIEIEGMKLSEGRDGKMRASGKVKARIEVPGLEDSQGVEVDVNWVQPDIFIFNGPVPSDSSSPSTISVPAPRKAFAHLVLDPLAATTTVPDPLRPNALLVEAPFEDAPLDVVSEAELSDFVGKVILKGGAAAGVKGTCDVSAHVDGLGERGIVIRGVEVNGEVWVGRR